MFLLLVLSFLNFFCQFSYSDIFPSLLTTNANMAIVIDREYLGDQYNNTKFYIENNLEYGKREILKDGNVNTHFYSWSAINVKKDLSIIFSITSCADSWKLFKAADRENLLHIAISEHDCARLPLNSAITIPIIEQGEETPQLLLDLRTMEVYKWKQVVIIYQETISSDLLTRIIKSITKDVSNIEASGVSLKELKISRLKENIDESIRTTLSEINSKKVGNNYLVLIEFNLLEKLMSIAKNLGLVKTETQWLYLISDTNSTIKSVKNYKNLLKEGDNVAFIYNNTVINEICNRGITCHIKESLEGLLYALNNAIIDEREMEKQVSDEEWEAIRPTKLERKKYLIEKVQNYLTYNGSCENCTKWNFESGETWGKKYQGNSFSDVEILHVGNWKPSNGPIMKDVLFPHIMHGFRRINLPLISFHNPPWQILKLNTTGNVINCDGIVFNIIKELAKNLNFTFTVQIINKPSSQTNDSDVLFLEFIKNSNITTYQVPHIIIDMIHNKSVILGAFAFTITDEYKEKINYTDPISIQPYTFLSARPRELSRALLFISPFAGDTWLCLSATIISIGPILFYIHKFSPVYEYKGIRNRGGLATIQNCIWYMYGALLQQGGMHLPFADSARIIVGSWWLVVLVIGTTYCGNLVAYLTFPKIEIPITTLNHLIQHQNSITWSYSKNTYFAAKVKKSNNEVYKTIYENAKEIGNFRSIIEEVKNGKHVYIDWKIKLQYLIKQQFIENGLCSFALGVEEFSDERIGLIVAPGTPYLNRINEEIKKLHQVGLIQKWLEDYLPKKDKCWKKQRSVEVNNHTVNLDDMQGSFFVLFIGFFIAILVIDASLWPISFTCRYILEISGRENLFKVEFLFFYMYV